MLASEAAVPQAAGLTPNQPVRLSVIACSCLSPVSTWESLVLARKGRLSLMPSPAEWVLEALRRSALTAIPLSHAIALRSERLEGLDSEDPADRFLVATALEHGLALVTADRAIHAFRPLTTLW